MWYLIESIPDLCPLSYLVSYVDDFGLLAHRDAIFYHKQVLLSTLENLGWKVNFEKSSLEPALVKEYICYLIGSTGEKPVIKIPRKHITKVHRDIHRCLRQGRISAHGLARIGGQCISMCKCIFPAKSQLRNLYRLLATKSVWGLKIQQ